MIKSVLKHVLIFAIFLLSVLPPDGSAETNVDIAIFPFTLYADQDRDTPTHDQIKDKIPLLISEKLEQEGTKAVLVTDPVNTASFDYAEFREQGIRLGVDYIIAGSVFIEGQGISIDAKLINIYKKNDFTTFSAEADTVENLFSATSQISKEIIGEVFHKQIIIDIAISGAKRVETDAILNVIGTRVGDIIKPDNISKDLRKIYEMGYFDNVIVTKESLDNGVKIVFEVTEKSTVRKVKYKGNTVYKDEELAAVVDTRTGGILNIHKLNADVNKMRLMYTEKNYHNCSVTYEVIPLEHSQADIVFKFEEGEKIRVESITFAGNQYFSDKEIKKVIETSEKGFFSFLTSSGNLNETEVKNDATRIEALYKNNGFIDTKVSDPIVDIGEKSISIHFKIDEGAQYKIKNIDLTGDLIFSDLILYDMIQAKKNELYNREVIRKDILSISDAYSNKGFANVDVRPVVNRDDKEHTVSISFSIAKGDPVYFNRINISGNTKTRDKVIRREVRIKEQGLYSKENIQRSFKNLNRLDYFEGIDLEPVKTDDPNKMDLTIKVTEKQTGSLSLGGGFSSDDGAFVTASITERNLFGKGQTGKISGNVSSESALFNISFFEPYIFDSRVSGGFDLYKFDKEWDNYDKEALGIVLKLGYRLFDYTRIGINYNAEDFDITNVQTALTDITPGNFFSSSIKPYIQYDSRNDILIPTEGSKHEFSIKYAGRWLGSDIDFTKYIAKTGVYFPLFWKFTAGLHAEGGYLDDRSSENINIDYEKFYLGGINSIRGFDKYDISGKRDGDTKEKGGEKYVQFNAEMTFPFTEKYKVAGVFFYDRGDVYLASEDIDFGDQYSSFGTGIRWNSPMGPLRLEYAWVIDGKTVKSRGDGKFEFAIGAFF